MLKKVSILIPCYNAEKWIAQAIQSAIDQSYENMEIIVVDDGSTDGSLDIIKSFRESLRWETVSHRGGNAVRNRLLEMASGEWLQYLDADDYLLPGKIAGQLAVLKAQPDADVVYSPVQLLEDFGQKKRSALSMTYPNDFFSEFLSWGSLQTSGMLWKKSVLREVGGWKEDQRVCQEHELMLRLIKAGKAFALHDDARSVYRYTEKESVSRKDKSVTVRERMRITDELESHLLQKNEITVERRRALSQSRFQCARNVLAKDEALAFEIIKKIQASDRFFVPNGKAAPVLYRWVYRCIGFRGAEVLARMRREWMEKCCGGKHG